jgi:hypothetical protein
MNNQRTIYPTFPAASWWPLRARFQKNVPAVVDVRTLCSVLDVEEKTARNLLPALRTLGLIDSEGVPTDLANRWRVDAEYGAACETMRRRLYPDSLFEEIPNPSSAFDRAIDWFMRESGVGLPAARRMAHLYQLLSEADPSRQHEHTSARRLDRTVSLRKPVSRGRSAQPSGHDEFEQSSKPGLVELHLHFDSNLSHDQIDQIFRSVSRHVGRG